MEQNFSEPTGPTTLAVSLFGIPLGLVALGLAWRMAETIWAVPAWVADALIWCGATFWAFLLMAYVGKWLLRTAGARAELKDPVQSCFIGLAGVVALLASMGVSRDYRPLAVGLYGFGVVWTLLFAIYQTGRLWMGDRKPETNTPILYLPLVGGGFVMASSAAALGYVDWGTFAFGAALFTWLGLEPVILSSLYTAAPIPPAVRPTLGVQLAPPAVGAVAYLSVGSGAPDMFAHALVGYALLQALLSIRLIHWLLKSEPTPAWWSFSFGAAALPTAAMKLVGRGDAGLVSIWAPYLFIVGNLVIVAIAAVTIRWAIKKARRPRSVLCRPNTDALGFGSRE
jgi:tellurite resistance protein